MDLYDELSALAVNGATAAEIGDCAEAILAAGGGGEAVARLAEVFAALEAETRQAHSRYRQMAAAGVHGGDPDPRAMPFSATTTYMRSGGLYLPGELAAMVASGQTPPAWHDREARRLLAFLGVLRALIRELDAGRLHPWRYGDEVIALAQRFGRMKVVA